MQIVEKIELISINGTLFFQLISFLIFLFLINRIMIRPLRRQSGERIMHLESITRDIATAQSTCDALDHEMKTQADDVRQTASAMRDELESSGKKAAEELIAGTREQINAMRSRAQKENEAEIAAVRKQLSMEAETIAHQIMDSLLGRRIES